MCFLCLCFAAVSLDIVQVYLKLCHIAQNWCIKSLKTYLPHSSKRGIKKKKKRLYKGLSWKAVTFILKSLQSCPDCVYPRDVTLQCVTCPYHCVQTTTCHAVCVVCQSSPSWCDPWPKILTWLSQRPKLVKLVIQVPVVKAACVLGKRFTTQCIYTKMKYWNSKIDLFSPGG